MSTKNAGLVDGLLSPESYPHPCSNIELVETHISWVFLTGELAYKVKKPIQLSFIDFSTLEKRRHYCEEELRLNQRLAPEIYLDVVPITDSKDGLMIGGDGDIIEYAVRMKQFDQSQLMSKIDLSQIDQELIDQLAETCAAFHETAAIAVENSDLGTLANIMKPVLENFEFLKEADSSIRVITHALEKQSKQELKRLSHVFMKRKRNNRIRECHGDLHLGNMFVENEKIAVFDGIEFNDSFRWIDVISDIAFVVMDLEDRGYRYLANRFLNRWLEVTGDFAGLRLLPFYCSYRAAVRAKVDSIRMRQGQISYSDYKHLLKDCRGYLELAKSYSIHHRPSLMITHGVSGSGKSTITQQLIQNTDTIRIRSDVERKRLFGLNAQDDSNSKLNTNLYSPAATIQTYERLEELTKTVIEAGYSVVVDATFLKRDERDRFCTLAEKLGVAFLIIKCSADVNILTQRIRKRRMHGGDASEADEFVLKSQLRNLNPLSSSEEHFAIDSSSPKIVSTIEHLVRRN